MNRPLLLVVGGEKRGISRAVLDQADQVVRIDYGRDFRGSLSAASAATVLGFEVLRQNSSK
jgi:23S rRNA (guanosine2251-2'-O)-methyltransferase